MHIAPRVGRYLTTVSMIAACTFAIWQIQSSHCLQLEVADDAKKFPNYFSSQDMDLLGELNDQIQHRDLGDRLQIEMTAEIPYKNGEALPTKTRVITVRIIHPRISADAAIKAYPDLNLAAPAFRDFYKGEVPLGVRGIFMGNASLLYLDQNTDADAIGKWSNRLSQTCREILRRSPRSSAANAIMFIKRFADEADKLSTAVADPNRYIFREAASDSPAPP